MLVWRGCWLHWIRVSLSPVNMQLPDTEGQGFVKQALLPLGTSVLLSEVLPWLVFGREWPHPISHPWTRDTNPHCSGSPYRRARKVSSPCTRTLLYCSLVRGWIKNQSLKGSTDLLPSSRAEPLHSADERSLPGTCRGFFCP